MATRKEEKKSGVVKKKERGKKEKKNGGRAARGFPFHLAQVANHETCGSSRQACKRLLL